MARVLVKTENRWYEQLASISNYYEVDIEERILDHAQEIFKGYFALKFKTIIKDRSGGSATPDLVLIREDYTAWFIIEVELYKHGRTHPEKQIDVFIDGDYKSSEIVPYLIKKLPTLDEGKLISLIDREQPRVLVIVDGSSASWMEDFKKKVMVCIFEVYKNSNGTELFRLKGEYPYISLKETHLKGMQSSTYEIIDVKFLPHAHNDSIEITYMGNKMIGKVFDVKNKRYIIIQNAIIPPKKDLVIFLDINGNYVIRLN